MFNNVKKAKFFEKTICNVLLATICIVWTVPTVGLLVTSFRDKEDVANNGWWTVFTGSETESKGFTLKNYSQVLASKEDIGDDGSQGNNFFPAFLNSIAVAIPATIIPILIAAFAAYAFAWMKFPGRKLAFTIVVALLVVPLQIALIPILTDYNALGLTGTFLALWLAHTGFGLPLAIYLLFNYISQIPKSLLESAYLDGASHFTCFTKIILRISTPALASFAIFQFLWVWNDLLVAMVFLGTSPENAVVTSQLMGLIGERGSDFHLLCAGAFVTMVLPLTIFLFLQKYFVKGLMAGALKE